MERALVDARVHRHAIDLGVVGDEVLDGDRDVAAPARPARSGGEPAESSGSSDMHSKTRPPTGVRCRLTVGASSTCAPLRTASRPSSSPTSPMRSGSQVAPSAMPTGIETLGVARAPRASPRTPFGPSDIFNGGMPNRGAPWVRQLEAPLTTRHFSSRVRSWICASIAGRRRLCRLLRHESSPRDRARWTAPERATRRAGASRLRFGDSAAGLLDRCVAGSRR